MARSCLVKRMYMLHIPIPLVARTNTRERLQTSMRGGPSFILPASSAGEVDIGEKEGER